MNRVYRGVLVLLTAVVFLAPTAQPARAVVSFPNTQTITWQFGNGVRFREITLTPGANVSVNLAAGLVTDVSGGGIRIQSVEALSPSSRTNHCSSWTLTFNQNQMSLRPGVQTFSAIDTSMTYTGNAPRYLLFKILAEELDSNSARVSTARYYIRVASTRSGSIIPFSGGMDLGTYSNTCQEESLTPTANPDPPDPDPEGPGEGFEWPAFPDFNWPAFPQFTWPEFPRFTWPQFPTFQWPDFPEFTWPELPQTIYPELPNWTWPELPTFQWPAYPEFTWPELPQFEFQGNVNLGWGVVPEISMAPVALSERVSGFSLDAWGVVPLDYGSHTLYTFTLPVFYQLILPLAIFALVTLVMVVIRFVPYFG